MYISTEDVRRLGKDLAMTVQNPDNREQHLVILAVNYQLYCLNAVRQAIFPQYYDYGNTSFYWAHIYHCLHLLLDALKCASQTDLVTYYWMEGALVAQPDFAVNTMCRDWQGLKEWQNEYELDNAAVKKWRKPEEREVSCPPEWKELAANVG